jgi:hypothetical protein
MATKQKDPSTEPVTKGDMLALQKLVMASSQEINITLERIIKLLEKIAAPPHQ